MTEPDRKVDPAPLAADVVQRTSMAAERTWLAWWRTALAATVGSLAVGRLAPEVLHVATWPYVVLGAGYAGIAVGMLVTGARPPARPPAGDRTRLADAAQLPAGGAVHRRRGPARPDDGRAGDRPDVTRVRLAELIAMISLGTDLGMGQPMEHVMRQSLIALRLAERLGLDDATRAVVYYVSLISWVGCHVDAYEQAKWFGDDLALKTDARHVDMAGADRDDVRHEPHRRRPGIDRSGSPGRRVRGRAGGGPSAR